jgi:PAS domain-containing protein
VLELSDREDNAAQLYKNLFEDSKSVMLIINPETGEIIDVNSSACKYYQYSKDQITKMSIMDINILPLCSFCKKIRDSKGNWDQVDTYIHNHSDADISHTVCPECMDKYYPEYFDK